jgi:hypothetical protein
MHVGHDVQPCKFCVPVLHYSVTCSAYALPRGILDTGAYYKYICFYRKLKPSSSLNVYIDLMTLQVHFLLRSSKSVS